MIFDKNFVRYVLHSLKLVKCVFNFRNQSKIKCLRRLVTWFFSTEYHWLKNLVKIQNFIISIHHQLSSCAKPAQHIYNDSILFQPIQEMTSRHLRAQKGNFLTIIRFLMQIPIGKQLTAISQLILRLTRRQTFAFAPKQSQLHGISEQ